MKEILQVHIGLSKEGEQILEGFVYEDAIITHDKNFVSKCLNPIIEALDIHFKFLNSLELGSGNGSFSYFLKQKNPNNIVVTCDINKDSANYEYYKNLNHFILRTDEPFKIVEDKDYFKFDMILSFEHFEHISPLKLDILGQNLVNHSRQGTIFFGSAPSYSRGSWGKGLVHPNCKSQEEWDIWFQNLGFKKLDFSILNNRDLYQIPYEAYMNSSELLYVKLV